jgi:hypothetical protein
MKRLIGAAILAAVTIVGVVQGVVFDRTILDFSQDPTGRTLTFFYDPNGNVIQGYYTANGWALLAAVAGALLIALVSASLALAIQKRTLGSRVDVGGWPGGVAGTYSYDAQGQPVSFVAAEAKPAPEPVGTAS